MIGPPPRRLVALSAVTILAVAAIVATALWYLMPSLWTPRFRPHPERCSGPNERGERQCWEPPMGEAEFGCIERWVCRGERCSKLAPVFCDRYHRRWDPVYDPVLREYYRRHRGAP